ncbi:MAG TPA: glycosyltransferase family 4 protein [Candidatus Acidoferrales bacterium]|nr:glycosyltransferase family 4 protein [Candidatus Acidoferrales bacterium]
MHILLLNEYYPPDTSATAKMASVVVGALAQRHRITVLAGRPSYDPTEMYPWRLLRRETQGNVTIERVGSTAYPRFQMRRRVSNYLTYSAMAAFRALTIRADLVLCMTDPPFCGIVGAAISKLAGRPFVYNIRDLYPDMALGGEIVRPSLLARCWEQMHRCALRQAAKVIVLGDDMRERIIAKGIDSKKVTVIRDGIRSSGKQPLSMDNPVSSEIRQGFRFVALHAGNLGFYGAWDTLLAAGSRLENTGLSIIFVGEGAQKERLTAAARGTQSIRFLPFRPANEIPNVLAAGDVHIVTVKRGLEGVIVPSKLYGILAAGKPVLAVAPPATDVARIVTAAGCGVAVDPDDPEAVAAAIRELAALPERVAEMGRRALAIAGTYDIDMQLNQFVHTLEEVISA